MGWKSLFVRLHPSPITTRYTIYGQYIIILQQRNNTTILHRIVSIKNILKKLFLAWQLSCFFVFLPTLSSLFCPSTSQLAIILSWPNLTFFFAQSSLSLHDFHSLWLPFLYWVSIGLHRLVSVTIVQWWWIFHLKNIYFETYHALLSYQTTTNTPMTSDLHS